MKKGVDMFKKMSKYGYYFTIHDYVNEIYNIDLKPKEACALSWIVMNTQDYFGSGSHDTCLPEDAGITKWPTFVVDKPCWSLYDSIIVSYLEVVYDYMEY